jgi:hypothetical protein
MLGFELVPHPCVSKLPSSAELLLLWEGPQMWRNVDACVALWKQTLPVFPSCARFVRKCFASKSMVRVKVLFVLHLCDLTELGQAWSCRRFVASVVFSCFSTWELGNLFILDNSFFIPSVSFFWVCMLFFLHVFIDEHVRRRACLCTCLGNHVFCPDVLWRLS